MKNKVSVILWLLALFIGCNVLVAQEYKYDVNVFGKTIGTVIANRTIKGTKIEYSTNSLSIIRFFGKKEISTIMKTLYENNVLKKSFYEVKKNGKIREKSTLEYLNSTYNIITDGEKTKHTKPIHLSTIMLTYYKPKDKEKVFEEVGGFYKKIKKIKVNEFELINPRSRHIDTYIYNDEGIMEKCIVRKTLFNFEMILKSKNKQKLVGKL
ncbi:hypothetical protein DS884_03575 [Tenacibaculum sp. E3R01]|uniref:DUF6134 family protein n=1 Tax=Tenacibaculum sp. E3R01 TaxID=2267227 RepID=UPI000DE9AAC4|nr:DUF6134 family protein [Tenacibaculum sp. E3R01]RBW61401.1 hypothetical protein DS884_03575 [Tenacibaculum sp. E3R01]